MGHFSVYKSGNNPIKILKVIVLNVTSIPFSDSKLGF